MIQFNLLPDVKLEYIRSTRLKRTVVMVSMMVSGAALAVLVILFMGVVVFQKNHLGNLSEDITKKSDQLRKTPDLNKVLTVQSQLTSLNDLHDTKGITSRLPDFITKVTPTAASISSVTISIKTNTLSVTGGADALSTVNTFVDTLKFTNYKLASNPAEAKKAFKDVVLTSFTKQDKSVSYHLDFKYEPVIFAGNDDVSLEIPPGVTTRSTLEKPTAVFGVQ